MYNSSTCDEQGRYENITIVHGVNKEVSHKLVDIYVVLGENKEVLHKVGISNCSVWDEQRSVVKLEWIG